MKRNNLEKCKIDQEKSEKGQFWKGKHGGRQVRHCGQQVEQVRQVDVAVPLPRDASAT